jgi:hypothetical protein
MSGTRASLNQAASKEWRRCYSAGADASLKPSRPFMTGNNNATAVSMARSRGICAGVSAFGITAIAASIASKLRALVSLILESACQNGCRGRCCGE